MSDIISIYLHLDCPTFIAALARDDRSYSAGLFKKASRVLEGRNLKSPDEIVKLQELVRKVEDVRQQGAADEEELGEIPDEFLGRVSCCINHAMRSCCKYEQVALTIASSLP